MSPHEEKEPDQHEHESSCWFVSNKDLLKAILEMEERLNKRMAAIDDALSKIDTATTQIATNLTTSVGVIQTISTEVDTLVKDLTNAGVPQAVIDRAAALGDKAQAASDALAAQVPVLQAIAAKGVTNPVPVPVPPPTPPTP